MEANLRPPAVEYRTMVATPEFALVSALLPGSPATVLVQLHETKFGNRPRTTLYAVYREADMTFDAIAHFERPDFVTLEDVLREYVASEDFGSRVMAPIAKKVREHFGRH